MEATAESGRLPLDRVTQGNGAENAAAACLLSFFPALASSTSDCLAGFEPQPVEGTALLPGGGEGKGAVPGRLPGRLFVRVAGVGRPGSLHIPECPEVKDFSGCGG